MYLEEKPGQHSCQAVVVTRLWMSHRSDIRISIKPSSKTISFLLNLQRDLVWGNGSGWHLLFPHGDIQPQHWPSDLSHTVSEVCFQSLGQPLPRDWQRLTEKLLWWCAQILCLALSTPVKCPALRHDLQIKALEAKGSQDHLSSLSSLSFEAHRHTSVWQSKGTRSHGLSFPDYYSRLI